MEIITQGNKRTFTDIYSGRSLSEWKCAKCGEWLNDDVVWVNPDDGKATVEHGKPYCVDCAPEEREDTPYV